MTAHQGRKAESGKRRVRASCRCHKCVHQVAVPLRRKPAFLYKKDSPEAFGFTAIFSRRGRLISLSASAGCRTSLLRPTPEPCTRLRLRRTSELNPTAFDQETRNRKSSRSSAMRTRSWRMLSRSRTVTVSFSPASAPLLTPSRVSKSSPFPPQSVRHRIALPEVRQSSELLPSFAELYFPSLGWPPCNPPGNGRHGVASKVVQSIVRLDLMIV